MHMEEQAPSKGGRDRSMGTKSSSFEWLSVGLRAYPQDVEEEEAGASDTFECWSHAHRASNGVAKREEPRDANVDPKHGREMHVTHAATERSSSLLGCDVLGESCSATYEARNDIYKAPRFFFKGSDGPAASASGDICVAFRFPSQQTSQEATPTFPKHNARKPEYTRTSSSPRLSHRSLGRFFA